MGRYISAIWLTPQMDRLFRGGSQPRRSFLDRLVYAFDVEHAKRTSNFEHLYKQWYQLLKSGQTDNFWLTSLEEEMAGLGVAIAAARREQIAKLNTFIDHEPDDVFPNVKLELDGTVEKMLDNMPALDVEEAYAAKLKSQRRNVLYNDNVDGVNRTDFKVYYKKKECRPNSVQPVNKNLCLSALFLRRQNARRWIKVLRRYCCWTKWLRIWMTSSAKPY